jgi:3alpha(or 20beta)-hydroxysteroid dehydrogenase
MGRLDGKVTIVTGGARGTGEAIVRRFVAEGAAVLVLDLLEDRGASLVAELRAEGGGDVGGGGAGGDVAFLRGDVTDEADWAAAVEAVTQRWGKLDVLVNNAAILHLCPLDRTDLADFERVLRVNAVGPFLGIKACLPLLRVHGGSVVNVGSTDSISGTPSTAAYTSSKFALRGLTKVVALEEGKHGVRCNIVCPGGGNAEMVTEFFARHASLLRPDIPGAGAREVTPLGRRAELSELAGAVLYFASDDSTFCTGTELVIDGGLHAGMYVDVPGMFSTR